MKMKHLLVAAGLAMGVIAGAAIGLSAKAKTQETYAATSSVVIGSDSNGWNLSAEGWSLSLEAGTWSLTREMLAGDCFKFIVNNGSANTYIGWGDGLTAESGNPLGKTSTEYFASKTGFNDADIKCLKSGSYTFKAVSNIDTYGDGSYGIQIISNSTVTYSLFVNGSEVDSEMDYSGGSVTTNADVARGDVISIKKDGVLVPISSDDSDNNNLSSDLKIKVTGSQDFWFSPVNGTLWVQGYEELRTWVDAFLAGAVDTDCSTNPATTIKEGETTIWDWYVTNWFNKADTINLNQRAAFQAALSDLDGDPSSWVSGDELSEAAARYLYLATKYSIDNSAVISLSLKVAPYTNNINESSGSTILVISIIASAALLGFVGYFMVRRKKED